VSQRVQQTHPHSNEWFDRNFFDRHNIDIDYVGTGSNWWKPAAWGTLAAWGAWRWSTPYYYDDIGYAYPVASTENTYAYPESTAVVPYQSDQTSPIDTPQAAESASEEWLPLGVFAVTSNTTTAAQTSRFIQLALNRSGEIAGVLYNSTTDVAQDLTGMIDSNTQKAYWALDNRTNSPIASTGIYNLIQDQTPVNVHFSDGSEQTWTLVRLQQK